MNALEIENLTKSYNGFLLDRLNLTLPNGCILGLIGENGAGKSTTMKLILDRIRRDSGRIRIFGQDNTENPAALKEDIGVVMDEVGIPECLTAGQLGRVLRHTYRNWNDEEYRRLLSRFSLPENKPFGTFSRGMKMKTGIAAALSHGSRLLLLDEATSGLDPVARDEVVELLGEFTRDENHSILISSHIVSDLEKLCDYVAFLHRGKLLLCEEKDVLLAEYGVIHCTAEELGIIPAHEVLYRKETGYGAEAIVRRCAVPRGAAVSPVSIEELFIVMAKEAG